jgi:hypothetical protein
MLNVEVNRPSGSPESRGVTIMFRTRIALAVAAAAITLTTLLSPTTPANAAGIPAPDLQLWYIGETGVGVAHFYQFGLQNIGQVTAEDPYVGAEIVRKGPNGQKISSWVALDLNALTAGTSRYVTVPCNDQQIDGVMMKCIGVRAHAGDPKDSNDSNNYATFGV